MFLETKHCLLQKEAEMLQLVLLTSQQHSIVSEATEFPNTMGIPGRGCVWAWDGCGRAWQEDRSRTVLSSVGNRFPTTPLCPVLSQVKPGTGSGRKPTVGRDSPFGVTFSDCPISWCAGGPWDQLLSQRHLYKSS